MHKAMFTAIFIFLHKSCIVYNQKNSRQTSSLFFFGSATYFAVLLSPFEEKCDSFSKKVSIKALKLKEVEKHNIVYKILYFCQLFILFCSSPNIMHCNSKRQLRKKTCSFNWTHNSGFH